MYLGYLNHIQHYGKLVIKRGRISVPILPLKLLGHGLGLASGLLASWSNFEGIIWTEICAGSLYGQSALILDLISLNKQIYLHMCKLNFYQSFRLFSTDLMIILGRLKPHSLGYKFKISTAVLSGKQFEISWPQSFFLFENVQNLCGYLHIQST